MTPELKDALARLARIRDQDDGYAAAVLAAYGHLPKGQLYLDTALVREFMAGLED